MLIKSNISKKKSLIAIVNIFSTSNNTIINISDIYNKTLLFGSGGLLGIKGSRRSTSYAGQTIAIVLGKKLLSLGVKYIYIKLRGFGKGRYNSVKSFYILGFNIINISDVTSLPFNGCKPSKRRRI
jgi:small subunit ribosomal protein S11